MIHYFRLTTSLALAVFFASGSIRAQETEARFQVRVMALSAEPMPDVFVKRGADYVPLEFSDIQPSAAVKAGFSNPLVLYKAATGPDGKPGFVVAEKVPVPGGGKDILLLGGMVAKAAKYFAIEDSFSSAKSVDWLVINTTPLPAQMQMGHQAKFVPLAPGFAGPFKVQAAVNTDAAVLIQRADGAKWRTIYTTYWPVFPDKRCVVLLYMNGKEMEVKKISDVTAVAPKEEKQQ